MIDPREPNWDAWLQPTREELCPEEEDEDEDYAEKLLMRLEIEREL